MLDSLQRYVILITALCNIIIIIITTTIIIQEIKFKEVKWDIQYHTKK